MVQYQSRWRFEPPPSVWSVRRSLPWHFMATAGPLHVRLAWKEGTYELSFACRVCDDNTRISGECLPCKRVDKGPSKLVLDPIGDADHALALFKDTYEEALVKREESPLRANIYSSALGAAFLLLAPAVKQGARDWDNVPRSASETTDNPVHQIMFKVAEDMVHQERLWIQLLENNRLEIPGCARPEDA